MMHCEKKLEIAQGRKEYQGFMKSTGMQEKALVLQNVKCRYVYQPTSSNDVRMYMSLSVYVQRCEWSKHEMLGTLLELLIAHRSKISPTSQAKKLHTLT